MRLISFDIGIKNMAYCIIELNQENATFAIRDWGILNLMDIVETDMSCTCNKTTSKKKPNIIGSICAKKAKYQKGGICYCEKHAKESGYILPLAKFSPTSLNKMKVADLIKTCNTYSIIKFDQDSRPPVKRIMVEKMTNYFSEKCLEPIIAKTAKTADHTDLITLGRNMKIRLDNVLQNGILGNLTHVIMENQISPIATRMKTIQGMLAQYFIQAELPDKTYTIEFISSSNKLKFLEKGSHLYSPVLENVVVEPATNDASVTQKSTYQLNKKSGIYYTRLILDKNQEIKSLWETTLSSCKKKDDLADCFLQGLWYMKRTGCIDFDNEYKITII